MKFLSFFKKDFFNKERPALDGFNIATDFVDDCEYSDLQPKKSKNYTADLIEWLEVVATAIIAVVLIFSFIFRIATIDGNSMLDTLHSGERVIISNLNYTAKNGDIVVISRNAENSVAHQSTNNSPIIKRVIATAGQTVNINFVTGDVYVDNEKIYEDYIKTPTLVKGDVSFPLYVPEGYIFVLGDNRNDSLDSRFSQIGDNGLVDTRYILGHAIFRVTPFNKIGELK